MGPELKNWYNTGRESSTWGDRDSTSTDQSLVPGVNVGDFVMGQESFQSI